MLQRRLKEGQPSGAIAVLFSGGLDSAVLVAHAAREAPVLPIFVAAGLAWEAQELRAAEYLVASGALGASVRPLQLLTLDMRDVYPPSHWAVQGTAPDAGTPDEDVFLDGRNIVLLSKASILAAREGIDRLWLGPLAGNPFPDATREFFDAMQRALSIGLGVQMRIETPFADRHKPDVIRLGTELGVPLEKTLSCMQPRIGQHCGRCSKCRERRDAFAASGLADFAPYADFVGSLIPNR